MKVRAIFCLLLLVIILLIPFVPVNVDYALTPSIVQTCANNNPHGGSNGGAGNFATVSCNFGNPISPGDLIIMFGSDASGFACETVSTLTNYTDNGHTGIFTKMTTGIRMCSYESFVNFTAPVSIVSYSSGCNLFTPNCSVSIVAYDIVNTIESGQITASSFCNVMACQFNSPALASPLYGAANANSLTICAAASANPMGNPTPFSGQTGSAVVFPTGAASTYEVNTTYVIPPTFANEVCQWSVKTPPSFWDDFGISLPYGLPTVTVTSTITGWQFPSFSNCTTGSATCGKTVNWVYGFIVWLLPMAMIDVTFIRANPNANRGTLIFLSILGLQIGAIFGTMLHFLPLVVPFVTGVIFALYLWKGRSN